MPKHLHSQTIDTPLGPLLALADEDNLYFLEFVGQKGFDRAMRRIEQHGYEFSPGDTVILNKIKLELQAYFKGELTEFKTPHRGLGSAFQQEVWQALSKIPYGQTRSYREQAQSLGRPKSFRAVANANGANPLAIIIPCHRVIASNGGLGGYGGGLAVKQWLLQHEKQISIT